MLGLGSSLSKGGAVQKSFVKDNLKLYLDFKSNKSNTLKFPCEGSTSFDGTDDYIDCGNDSTLQFAGSFSVGCWINTTDATASNTIILSKANDGTNDGWLLRLNSSRKVEFEIYRGGAINITDSGSVLNDGTWHHIVGVHESGVGNKLYKDGVEVASGTTGTDLTDHVPNFHIANQDYATDREIGGKICNVFAYSRVLSIEEINSVMRKNYSQLKTVEKTSLVSWWALDEERLVTVAGGADGEIDFSTWTADSTVDAGVNTFTRNTAGAPYSGAILVQNSTYKMKWAGTITSETTQIYITDWASVKIRTSGGMSTGTFDDTFYWRHGHASVHYLMIYMATSGSDTFPDTVTFSEITCYKVEAGDSHASNHGTPYNFGDTGNDTATTTNTVMTTSVYGGNAPVLPRAVDVAREGEADAIGDGSASFTASSSNYIISGSNIDLNGAMSRTFSAWIRPDDNPSSGNIYDVLSYGAGSNGNYFEFGIYNDSGTVKAWANVWGEDTSVAQTFTAGEWYHYAVVYTAINTTTGTLKLYINGILVNTSGTLGSSNAINTTNDQLDIGRRNSGSGYFNGDIAQLGAWAGALTQAQIQSVMESTSYATIPASVKSTLGASDWNLTTSSTTGTGNATSGGVITFEADGYQFFSGISNSTLYKVQYTIATRTAGGLTFAGGSSAFGAVTLEDSIGTHTYYFLSVNTTVSLRSTGFRGTITDYTAKEVTNDLVGYWGLDADNSVPALDFDGTSSDHIDLDSEINLGTTASYSFWSQRTDTSDAGAILGNHAWANPEYVVWFQSATVVQFRVAGDYITFTGGHTSVQGVWEHYVFTRSGTTVKMYIDGALKQTITSPAASGDFVAEDSKLKNIGAKNDSGGDPGLVILSSVSVYNKTLSASEVLSIYNDGIDGDESSNSGLQGYWKMDNTSEVIDLSGNSNNGTVNGTALIENAVALDSTDNNNEGSPI